MGRRGPEDHPRLQTDISRLLAQMNASIAEAEQFIKALP